MKTMRMMGLLLLVLLAAGCVTTPVVDTGMALIDPEPYQGWPQAFRLANASATVVIVPETGRMMHLGLRDGSNVLRNDPALLGAAPSRDEIFTNVGGDWLWPVAQSRWTERSGADWPPPKGLRDAPWHGRAWREPDGRQSCLLTRLYGAPVNALVTRQFTLDPGHPLVTVRQSMVATADAEVPLTFWSVMQVESPQQVFFPVRVTSAFKKGYKLMMGDAPPGPMTDCGEVFVCDLLGTGSSKIGMDSPVPWIAARKYDVITLIRADHPFSGDYPDGGCSLQLFSAGRNSYAEIETLSPEFRPRAGQSWGNTLTIELEACHPGTSPCLLAERLLPEEK